MKILLSALAVPLLLAVKNPKVTILTAVATVQTIITSAQYHLYEVSSNSPRDTSWMKSNTDSLFKMDLSRSMVFNGRLNPVKFYPYSALIGLPSFMTDTTTTKAQLAAISSMPANYYPLTGNPSNFLTSVPAQSWASIIGKPAIDYTNSANTVADSAVFYLTNDKTSTGTALYSTVTYVNPIINNRNGNYTFDWTVSSDKKVLTVKSKVATNTAVIALLGISVLGSTVNVSTGTTISVLVKGN